MDTFENRLAHESLTTLLTRCQPHEVNHLLDQLRAGRIDGTDRAACLVGHVARLRGQSYETCRFGYSWEHPASTWHVEDWLKVVRIGDTPRNSAHARMLEGWLMAWIEERTLELLPLQPAVQQVMR